MKPAPGILLTLLIAALATAAISPPGLAQEREEREVLKGLDRVAVLLEAILDNYMVQVDAEDLVENGIRGMLGRLDPHSSYFPPEQTRQFVLEQQGEYFGVGLTVGIRNGVMTVISPMEGGPAARQGIRTGDLIRAIDGKLTAGEDLDTNARRLRGPEGTEVTVTIEREGLPEPFDVVIKREKISLKTVPYAMMINGSGSSSGERIGYVRLVRFAGTSSAEVTKAIENLKAQGMEGLILDLRTNPGGDLSQAVAVANCFLDDGLIVYTKGSTEASRTDYKASPENTCWKGPLVVLINRGSASASEVVSGALQDQDRALLVGDNSWGKGLVQTVVPLSHGAALALTTARYFTPSGRLIQRKYTPGSFDEYFYYENGEPSAEEMQPAHTSLGRIVYGGNGLQPDVVVKEKELTALSQQVLLRGLLFDFVTHYLGQHPGTGPDFVARDEVMSEFRAFIVERGLEVKPEEWSKDKSFLATRITFETIIRVAGAEAAFRTVLPFDHQIQRAIGLLDKAAELWKRKLQKAG